jgi:hypothetical protein
MSPTVPAIVPARDAAAAVAACGSALRNGIVASQQRIVADDGSSGGTAADAREAGAEVIFRPSPDGPAAARDTGAALTCDSAPFAVGLALRRSLAGGQQRHGSPT